MTEVLVKILLLLAFHVVVVIIAKVSEQMSDYIFFWLKKVERRYQRDNTI